MAKTDNRNQVETVRWTPEQRRVIEARGHSLLVSAAAGSGKTAVLVERIVSMITDPVQPIDVDRLLVVTFTNAAAAEMRERVLAALEMRQREDPQNRHLQRQMTLVHNASIMTIDSFCLDVIRNHFHRIGLSPGFRIADEGELILLRAEVCDTLLEDYYKEGTRKFLDFADSYSTAKSDASLCAMIEELYRYAQSYPWPEEWLALSVGQYRADSVEELEEKPWVNAFLSYLHALTKGLYDRYRSVYALTLDPDGPAVYKETVQEDLKQMEKLLSCSDLSTWKEGLDALNWKNLPPLRNFKGDTAKKDAVKTCRDETKKQLQDFAKKYFSSSPQEQLARLGQTGEKVEMLLELVRAFGERFAEEKAKRNMLDFSDVEHYALQILVDSETREPTAAAAEYRSRFAEIMIDEYQDSSYLQEAILTAVSGLPAGKENRFMVGDVKQSIYRFRLARPELFTEKYASFGKGGSGRERIDLHSNFRSRGEVIEFVNAVFSRVMLPDLGKINYDEDAALHRGAVFPEDTAGMFRPECILVSQKESAEAKQEAEALVCAQRIHALIEGGELPGKKWSDVVILVRSLNQWAETFQRVFEREGIPLVVTSRTGYFEAGEVQTVLAFLRVLDNPCQDIPLTALMRSAIGNFSDEELAAVRAADGQLPFWACVKEIAVGAGGTENTKEAQKPQPPEEYAAKADSAQDAQEGREPQPERENAEAGTTQSGEAAAKTPLSPGLQKKVRDFYGMVDTFRARVPDTPIHLLLQQVLSETGYRDYVSALPGGERRRANLDMLVEKAIAFEKTSYHGLYHFVRYIDRLMKYEVDYGEAQMPGEDFDAVRLMTIHKSKGLEFPVVFVAGMARKFNTQDERGAMILHPDYGVGLKFADPDRHLQANTLIRSAFACEVKRENLGEELRVLYVALTRAKEKLILVGDSESGQKAFNRRIARAGQEESGQKKELRRMDFAQRMNAKCPWDWILPAVADCAGICELRISNPEDRERNDAFRTVSLAVRRNEVLEQLSFTSPQEERYFEEISRRFAWKYPYPENPLSKQKVSVSEMKQRSMEEMRQLEEEAGEEELFPEEIPVPYLPRFVKEEETAAAGALRGTAMHRFLACVDFSRLPGPGAYRETKQFIEETLQSLLAKGSMANEEAGLINEWQLRQFLASQLAGRMRAAAAEGKLFREQPFVMSLPAASVGERLSVPDLARPGKPETGKAQEEQILVQGMIDAFWEEEDGIVLLDYKTDRVMTPQELTARYREQMLLYACALGRAFPGKPVKEVLIYSFRLNQILSCKET